jgi:hypothetical protein
MKKNDKINCRLVSEIQIIDPSKMVFRQSVE